MMKNKASHTAFEGNIIKIFLFVSFFVMYFSSGVSAFTIEKQPNGTIINVSGYVICKGERIPDVAVEAADEMVISDEEGKFYIEVKKGSSLIFHKEGYSSFEYIVDEPQEKMIVCLLPDYEMGTTKNGTEPTKNEIESKKIKSSGEKESVLNITTKKDPAK